MSGMKTLLKGLYYVLKKNKMNDPKELQAILDDFTLILRTVELGNVAAVDQIKRVLREVSHEIELNQDFRDGDKLLKSIKSKVDGIIMKEYVDYTWSDGQVHVKSLKE